MEIGERVCRDVVIVEPTGRLTEENELQFRETFRRLLEQGRTRLVLNLAGVPSIDSVALGAIAQAYISARRRGGELKLLHVTGQSHQLLATTKLLTVFETFDSEHEAELSFSANP
jgi:anti-sigma B factor antagonist